MILDKEISEIRRYLEEWQGFPILSDALSDFDDLQVYLAGGIIRNQLLGEASISKDFDFFLQGASVKSAMNLFLDHGDIHYTPYGAPRWYPEGDNDRYADLIPIADFVPGLWRCEDIIDVLNQFDFTANAVAFDIRTGEVFDPQNGVRDSRRRVMKMVRFDYPDAPFIEGEMLNRNVILWFRIIHYSSRLGLSIEPLTREWLLKNCNFQSYFDDFTRRFFRPDLSAFEELLG